MTDEDDQALLHRREADEIPLRWLNLAVLVDPQPHIAKPHRSVSFGHGGAAARPRTVMARSLHGLPTVLGKATAVLA
jgi:hypothetical protein